MISLLRDTYLFIMDTIKNIRPVNVLALVLCIIVLVVFYPLLNESVYYTNLKNRVDVLSTILSIDVNSIEDERLVNEYTSILESIENNTNSQLKFLSIKNYILLNDESRVWKFISGGILCWIASVIGIVTFFMDLAKCYKTKKYNRKIESELVFNSSNNKYYDKLGHEVSKDSMMKPYRLDKGVHYWVLGLIFLGGILGFVFMLIPTIHNPLVNYIGAPVIQLVLLFVLVFLFEILYDIDYFHNNGHF